MNTVSFRAMGTAITVIDPETPDASGCRWWFDAVERVASRFIPTSELSRLNALPGKRHEVSEILANILHRAQEIRANTAGLVDPAVGGDVIAWGYDTTFGEVVDRSTVPENQPVDHDWKIEDSTVFREPGVILDLGGIAKGWTCDVAVAAGMGTVVSAGGDLRSSNPDTVAEIVDPWDKIATTVHVGIGGLATSSTTRRQWKVGNRSAHHIIDPRTGGPAISPIVSATVSAATATAAEAGAKAALLLGADGLAWAEKQDWIRAALVVWNDGNVYATTEWEIAA
jgi:FAD:protein FMN transferase